MHLELDKYGRFHNISDHVRRFCFASDKGTSETVDLSPGECVLVVWNNGSGMFELHVNVPVPGEFGLSEGETDDRDSEEPV